LLAPGHAARGSDTDQEGDAHQVWAKSSSLSRNVLGQLLIGRGSSVPRTFRPAECHLILAEELIATAYATI
jgi:hypothetical protein